ncbi:MAG: carboxypeptidase regulatory-like domain-containing protein [Sedimentisphaerales bacterium]|jgi:protocatechuate 3,4-dioxygenase beta subunit
MRLIIVGLLILSYIFCSGSSAADAPKKITCSGKVVDDANKPIAGAKVTLYRLMPDVGEQELKKATTEEQITKEDGSFSFSEETLTDKQYQFAMLIARKDGFAIGWDNWDMRKDKTTMLPMSKPYTLRGIVVDDANKPIVGAEVRISMLLLGNLQSGPEKFRYLTSIEPLDLLVTTTDSKGIFVFNNIPAEAKAEFTVKKAGMATISTFKPPQAPIDASNYNPGQYTVQSKDIRIVQPVEVKIEGKVIEKETGKAVGGVRLMCYTPGGTFGVKPVVSKDDGTFSFEGLEAKTYTIRDVSSRDKPAQWVIKPATVTIAAGQTSSGIILEASKGGMLEVTIRDNEKKQVAGANVYVRMNNNDKQGGSGVSNSDGIAAIRLEPGEYTLQVAFKEGYSSVREQKTVTVEDGKTTRLEIELKANPRITGIVRDPNGRPVVGASLRICPMGQKETNSDKEGKFEISWNPEQRGTREPQLVLVARHAGQNLAAVVDIDEDTKTFDVNMSPGIVFTGAVIDPNGKPIAGARVGVRLRVSNYESSIGNDVVVTDQEGGYEYKAVPEGQKYSVSAQADGYGSSDVSVDTDNAVNNRLEIKPLTLKTANMSISGIVVDVNDKPVANVDIGVSGEGQQYRRGTTDAKGKFIIDKLCDGQVQVNANVRSIGMGSKPMYGNVSTKAGATDVKVVLGQPGGEVMPDMANQPSGLLEVVIKNDEKKPIAGAQVSVREKDGNRGQSGVSNADGIASLKLLPGEFEIQRVYKEGYSFEKTQQTLTIEVGKTARVEIELKAVPKITGIVRDPNGQPVARAAMRVFPRGQNVSDSDKEGRFEIFCNPEQWSNQESQPVLVVRHIRRNLAAAVDINENTKTFDVNMTPGIVFTGAVIDPNDELIAGARINVTLTISGHGMDIDTADIATDQEGQYEVKTIPAGRQYTVSTRVEGYYPGYVKVDADGAVNNRLEIPLLKLKTADMNIAGIAVDVNDRPVANARIFVIEEGQQSPDRITDEQGRFAIDKLCAGQVNIYARAKDGQTELYGNTIVSAGDTDVRVVVAPPNAIRRPSSKIDSEQFEQAKKTLATLAQCANKEELEAAIDKAKATVDKFGGGHVIVGRVVLDGQGDVRYVAAQMEILTDGYFAGETKDLIGPVGFRMHQYAPYDLKLRGMKGSLVDVGTIHMTPLKEDQLVALKGKVALEENGDSSQAVLYLSVRDGPINTPHNGTSPRRYWPNPIKIQALENGLIEASGFSPISYYCRVTAPGYLEKVFPIEFNAGQTFDLGTITLEIPRQILLSYIVSAEPPFDLSNLRTEAIPAGTRWKASDANCYGWYLEFAQDKGSIIMEYSYAPCFLRDLGKGEIADYVNIDETKIGQQQPQNLKAKNEHVYLLHQVTWKRWVLFKIIIE